MGIALLKLSDEGGQGTVEFAVMFPVVLVVAIITMNALLFFGECVSYDKQLSQAVRAVAASPAYGQGVGQSAAAVDSLLQSQFDDSNLSSHVVAEGTSDGFVRFTGTLEFAPTLFGLGLKDEVLGVPLPKLKHSAGVVVDVYHPGVLL